MESLLFYSLSEFILNPVFPRMHAAPNGGLRAFSRCFSINSMSLMTSLMAIPSAAEACSAGFTSFTKAMFSGALATLELPACIIIYCISTCATVGFVRVDVRLGEREIVVYWYSFSNLHTMCIHCGFSLVSLRLQPCLLDQCQVALHLSYLAQEGVVCMTTSSVNPGTFFRFIVVGSSTPGQMPGQVPNAMRQMPLMPLGNMYGICSHRGRISCNNVRFQLLLLLSHLALWAWCQIRRFM